MGLGPKVACKPHAPHAEQLWKQWPRPGALFPREWAAPFFISQPLNARLESRQPIVRPTMKQRSVFLRTQSVAVALRAARRAHFEHVSSTRRTGKQLQRMRRASFRRASVRIHLFAAVFAACFASPADAITLENVLQTTLE